MEGKELDGRGGHGGADRLAGASSVQRPALVLAAALGAVRKV
jgi:hypothetical protein